MKPVRTLLVTALLLALTLVPAQAQSNDLDGIQAAYQDMLQLFYRPLPPGDLLRAGWGRLQIEARQRGAADPPALPDLPDDPNAAFQAFAGPYQAYAPSLPPNVAAMSVESGMADSVHENHTHALTAG